MEHHRQSSGGRLTLLREQLVPIARRDGVPLHAVERDYIEHLLLRHAGREPLTLKGGTCLRIVHGSPRYSEELDFDAQARDSVLRLLREAVDRLGDYGIRAEIVERVGREKVLHAILRFEGPLFDGNPRSRGSVRLETNLRTGAAPAEEAFVPRTPYADVPQLVLRVLSKEHLFAEKVRALLVRGKPRDLYDVHFLLRSGFLASPDLLADKMALYGRGFTLAALDRGIRSAGRTWERDLEPLLGLAPPFRAVASEVRRGMRTIVGR
jgi:predicted nucleotidyltransferase component of viral defense system